MNYDLDCVRNAPDSFLATCVDEYVKRIIQTARSQEYNENIHVNIGASQYRPDGEFAITHKVGAGYGESNVDSSNALEGVRIFVRRWREDKGMAPEFVRPMLPAPAPTDYAEFTEVTSTRVDDDIPF